MKRKRYSEEQVIEILRLHNAGEARRALSPARDQRDDAVQLAVPLWRDAGVGRQAAAVGSRSAGLDSGSGDAYYCVSL
jgi:hypothetical protein